MKIDEDTASLLGVALNEADLLDVALDPELRGVSITFGVLSLPEQGPMPDDRRVVLELRPVGRVAVSYRAGRWDDDDAKILPVTEGDLGAVVASFGQQPVYGWDFINVPPADGFLKWSRRLSLDRQSEDGAGMSNTIELFQESLVGEPRHLDMQFWFDELRIVSPVGREIPLADFITDGKRWWEGMYAGDERTKNASIVPAKADEPPTGPAIPALIMKLLRGAAYRYRHRPRTVKVKATITAVDQDGNVIKPHRRRLRRVRCNAFMLVVDEALARKLYEQLAWGEATFGELAEAHSQLPGEPDGVFLGGGFIPELEAVIDGLRPNQVSEPIHTDLGWFLVQRRRHRWLFD